MSAVSAGRSTRRMTAAPPTTWIRIGSSDGASASTSSWSPISTPTREKSTSGARQLGPGKEYAMTEERVGNLVAPEVGSGLPRFAQ